MQSYYDVLGVPASATLDQLQHAWKIKLQLLHPDLHQGAGAEVIEAAEHETALVNEAWSVLRDPVSRGDYDRSLAAGADRSRPRASQQRAGPPSWGGSPGSWTSPPHHPPPWSANPSWTTPPPPSSPPWQTAEGPWQSGDGRWGPPGTGWRPAPTRPTPGIVTALAVVFGFFFGLPLLLELVSVLVGGTLAGSYAQFGVVVLVFVLLGVVLRRASRRR